MKRYLFCIHHYCRTICGTRIIIRASTTYVLVAGVYILTDCGFFPHIPKIWCWFFPLFFQDFFSFLMLALFFLLPPSLSFFFPSIDFCFYLFFCFSLFFSLFSSFSLFFNFSERLNFFPFFLLNSYAYFFPLKGFCELGRINTPAYVKYHSELWIWYKKKFW